MKYVQFEIAGDHFVVPVDRVEEVTPLVKVHELGKGPGPVAGLMDYRGNKVPVLDLSLLIRGKASRRAMSSRIIVVRCDGKLFNGLAGLLAENVLDLVAIAEEEFASTGVDSPDTPFLGGVASVNGDLTQLLLIDMFREVGLGGLLTDEAERA